MQRRTKQQRIATEPERLESRALLAADLAAIGTRQFQWMGGSSRRLPTPGSCGLPSRRP
jgi:hypothetical protein